jgi:hypothetical protein
MLHKLGRRAVLAAMFALPIALLPTSGASKAAPPYRNAAAGESTHGGFSNLTGEGELDRLSSTGARSGIPSQRRLPG